MFYDSVSNSILFFPQRSTLKETIRLGEGTADKVVTTFGNKQRLYCNIQIEYIRFSYSIVRLNLLLLHVY